MMYFNKWKSVVPRLLAMLVFMFPVVAMAAVDWDKKLIEIANSTQTAMFALGGSLAGCTLIWNGIQWMISRANGDHQHSFLDYVKQSAVILAVGGAIVIAAAAWAVLG